MQRAQTTKNGVAKATVRATKGTLAMTKECADDDALEVVLVDLKSHVVVTVIGTRRLTSRKRYVSDSDADRRKFENSTVEIRCFNINTRFHIDYRLLGVLRSE